MKKPIPHEPAASRRTKREFKREPLTEDEMNAIANACETAEEKLVIWVLLDTGLRVSEFCNLTKDNIDWQTHEATFRGKGGKRRKVKLKGRTRAILENYIAAHDRIEISPRKAQRIVDKMANRAKIVRKCSPHILRHSFAVNAIRRGVPSAALQEMLGHENLTTTEIYVNMTEAEVMNIWDKYL